MNILVLGANGKTGRLVVEQALAAGHTVKAFVRDPSKLKLSDKRLSVKVGDARFVETVRDALKGQDAVINTIGGGERKLIAATMASIVVAMQKSGVRRIVTMSTFMATPNFKSTGVMKRFPRLVSEVVKDDLAGVKFLEASGLDWTIVYATLLKNKPKAGFRVVKADEQVTSRSRINRADVAECLLDVLDDRGTIGRSLLITGR